MNEMGFHQHDYFYFLAELSVVVCDTAAQALKLLNLAETIPFVKHLIIMNTGDDLTALRARAGDAIQVFTFTEILVSLCNCAMLLLPRSLLFRNASLFDISDPW